jgi:hypothetical protein
LYNKILHKCEFGQAHYVELLKRSPIKFSLPFLDNRTSFYEFWEFETISRIYEIEKRKNENRHWAGVSAQDHSAGVRRGLAACCGGWVPHCGSPSGGLARPSRWPTVRVRAARSGVVTAAEADAVAQAATAHQRLARRGVEGEGEGMRAVGGCARQEEKRCGSPRRMGVGEVAGRGWRGGVPMAEDGS